MWSQHGGHLLALHVFFKKGEKEEEALVGGTYYVALFESCDCSMLLQHHGPLGGNSTCWKATDKSMRLGKQKKNVSHV